MSTTQRIVLAFTALTTALMAGLFFAYSCSVGWGLGKMSDAEYLAAMQSINREIQNPIFFTAFIGAPVLLLVNLFLQYKVPYTRRFVFSLLAALVYCVGVMGVTMLGNIPLNEGLDKFALSGASLEASASQRVAFEKPWNTLNDLRTVASTTAIFFLILACLTAPTAPDA